MLAEPRTAEHIQPGQCHCWWPSGQVATTHRKIYDVFEDAEQLVIARAIFGMSVRERWTRSLAVMGAGCQRLRRNASEGMKKYSPPFIRTAWAMASTSVAAGPPQRVG